jgi:hypothetical protein
MQWGKWVRGGILDRDTQRQVTQHDWLPSLLGDGDKGRTKISCAITTSQTWEDTVYLCSLISQFPYPSVLTVSRGRPPLSNLSVLDLGKNELRRSTQDWNIFLAIAYADA